MGRAGGLGFTKILSIKSDLFHNGSVHCVSKIISLRQNILISVSEVGLNNK